LWSCVAAQLHEEGDDSYCRLLLPDVELYSAAQLHEEGDNSCTSNVCSCGAALQRNIAKKATLCCSVYFVALQRSGAKEGDGNYRRLLLSVVELRYSAAKEGNSVVELRCNAM